MKESKFFAGLSIVLVCTMIGLFGSIGSVNAADISLTYANFPPATTFPCVQMERWCKEVEKRTNGKVSFKTFPGGTLLGAKNMFDGVVSGTADIGCLATAYQPGRFKMFQSMDLPIGFPSAAVASATMWDLYEKYHPESFKKVKVITLFTCAPAQILSKKEVKSLEDLEGLKLRAAGTGVKIMKLLGAAPVGMPQSEVPEALQKGVVQGNVTSMDVLKDMKYAEYCPYVTVANLWVVPFAVVMNKAKWESLPDDVKKVIDDMRKEQAVWTGKYVDQHAQKAKEWSIEEHNVKVYELSPEQQEKWLEKASPVIDEYVKTLAEVDLPGKDFLKDLKELKKKYTEEMK